MPDIEEIVNSDRKNGSDVHNSSPHTNSINKPSATLLSKPVPIVSYPTGSLQFLRKIREPLFQSNELPKQARLSLKIIIVGAGLGGLATAIALGRRGHSVTVLEQAQEVGEVGAGIQIPPNSSLLLERWGVTPFLAGNAVEPREMTFRRWQNGSVIGRTKLIPDFRENFGAPYYVAHRAHFHDSLLKRAQQLGVEIKVDSRVVTYDLEAPSVTLANGALLLADLIVAADGAIDQVPVLTGFAAYRATVDVERIKADPELSWIIEKPCLNIWIGEGRHVMTYTIAAGKSFNMVLSHVDRSHPSTWKNESAIEDMGIEFFGWDPQLTKIIHMIDKTIKWPLLTVPPLQSWISPSSKVLILGDAAHAMVPYMSQGAAMAVEDGAALATVLNRIHNRSSIPFSIRVFEKERLKRTSQMQEASLTNGILWHFPDGPEQAARDEAMRHEVEGRHFLSSANQWSDPLTQWWAYGYDAEAVMESAWEIEVSALIAKAC